MSKNQLHGKNTKIILNRLFQEVRIAKDHLKVIGILKKNMIKNLDSQHL